jgi:hypothetical protein
MLRLSYYKYGDNHAKKKSKILQFIREKILSEKFKTKNKISIKNFTRDRKLTFSKMITLMSRKSVNPTSSFKCQKSPKNQIIKA